MHARGVGLVVIVVPAAMQRGVDHVEQQFPFRRVPVRRCLPLCFVQAREHVGVQGAGRVVAQVERQHVGGALNAGPTDVGGRHLGVVHDPHPDLTCQPQRGEGTPGVVDEPLEPIRSEAAGRVHRFHGKPARQARTSRRLGLGCRGVVHRESGGVNGRGNSTGARGEGGRGCTPIRVWNPTASASLP
ncbi:MAG: hypothetical protein M5U20_02385 [Phycisphaerales bacterium]|nr:hypothetical protein [Phycisphaerales bacterium]